MVDVSSKFTVKQERRESDPRTPFHTPTAQPNLATLVCSQPRTRQLHASLPLSFGVRFKLSLLPEAILHHLGPNVTFQTP